MTLSFFWLWIISCSPIVCWLMPLLHRAHLSCLRKSLLFHMKWPKRAAIFWVPDPEWWNPPVQSCPQQAHISVPYQATEELWPLSSSPISTCFYSSHMDRLLLPPESGAVKLALLLHVIIDASLMICEFVTIQNAKFLARRAVLTSIGRLITILLQICHLSSNFCGSVVSNVHSTTLIVCSPAFKGLGSDSFESCSIMDASQARHRFSQRPLWAKLNDPTNLCRNFIELQMMPRNLWIIHEASQRFCTDYIPWTRFETRPVLTLCNARCRHQIDTVLSLQMVHWFHKQITRNGYHFKKCRNSTGNWDTSAYISWSMLYIVQC